MAPFHWLPPWWSVCLWVCVCLVVGGRWMSCVIEKKKSKGGKRTREKLGYRLRENLKEWMGWGRRTIRCEEEKVGRRWREVVGGWGGQNLERKRGSQTLLRFGHHGNTARLLVGLAGAAATWALPLRYRAKRKSLHGARQACRATGSELHKASVHSFYSTSSGHTCSVRHVVLPYIPCNCKILEKEILKWHVYKLIVNFGHTCSP